MNRQQRRQYERKGIDTRVLEDIKQEVTKDACAQAYQMLLATVALYMHDKHGWGQQRIGRLMEHVNTMFDDMTTGLLSIDDVIKAMEDELDIHFKITC